MRLLTLDSYAEAIISKNENMMVPWYLMASYLYYVKDQSIFTDAYFDELCVRMLDSWGKIKHFHKKHVDIESLKAGTGFTLTEKSTPTRVKYAAIQAYKMLDGKLPI